MIGDYVVVFTMSCLVNVSWQGTPPPAHKGHRVLRATALLRLELTEAQKTLARKRQEHARVIKRLAITAAKPGHCP